MNIVSEEIGKIERGYEQNLVIDPLDGVFENVELIRNPYIN